MLVAKVRVSPMKTSYTLYEPTDVLTIVNNRQSES